ncbi:hypothetical protein GCK32_003261 [Trichostrongylus colubriformis]|uniref:F-box domain-containing protein n=1 Tax=Trichostrongylus colubriformis TaxID=6319 RepID=A0AAN8EZB9_TRICO
MFNHHPIWRCEQQNGDGDNLPSLPDEIIAHIISTVSPTEIITLKWFGINSGFDHVVNEHIRKCTSLNICEDFIWQYLQSELIQAGQLSPSHRSLLHLLMMKSFCHLQELIVPIAIFSEVHSTLEGMCSVGPTAVAMPQLSKISVHIGEEWGKLLISHNYDNLKIRPLCTYLSEVNLDLKLSDVEIVTCCGFRSLVRYFMEMTDSNTVWNLTLEDCTSSGQGYYGPTDMNRCRNKVFISYVRVLLDLGLTINRLTLLDRRKISPYMMIMSLNKRRSLYMYPEFKRCRELFVCYDIGLIAPIFAHENDRFLSLRIFEVDESHVLYKKDLLEYLSSAPSHFFVEHRMTRRKEA